ncbi:tRNA 5-methoxyuridine(34)/uridine 5-oxyacetic acid(34) synthase CmoB [Aurantivibrio plasticivorans]
MNYFSDLQHFLSSHTALKSWGSELPAIIAKGLSVERYGDLPGWKAALDSLPNVTSESMELATQVRFGETSETDSDTKQKIKEALEALIPWRKGPFSIHDTFIDTEWRSDWKWDRLIDHIAPLNNKLVLDVGCGNGYHCWRMLGAGAQRVIGIDPSPRFVMQFYATKHFAPDAPIDVIPATLDDFSQLHRSFDSVFSMGVLYHRPSPIDHLKQLKSTIRQGGQLILETLVIEGKLGETLVPEGRYAKMNNVWFIPTPETLVSWLKKLGFKNPRVVDINQTTIQEQRATEWMKFQSLPDFLDPADHNKTIEGHPAPRRAIIVAECP